MEKAYEYAKQAVLNYKLDRCCCFAPIRVGVFIVGYFNMFIAVLSLLGTADGGVSPPLMEVQEVILEDNSSKALGILAYSGELAFSALLQWAMYRNDMALLRVYLWFTVAQTLTQLVIYSILMVLISLLTKIFILLNIIYNCYVILIVRSAIVEIKETTTNEKNGHVVLYSLAKIEEPPADVEAAKQHVIEKLKILEKVELEDKTDKPKIEDKKDRSHNSEDETGKVSEIEDKEFNVPVIEDKKDKVIKIDDKKGKVATIEGEKDEMSKIEGKTDKFTKTEDKKDKVSTIEDKVPKVEDKKDKVTKIDNIKNIVLKIERKKHKVTKTEDKKDEEKTKLETVTENTKE